MCYMNRLLGGKLYNYLQIYDLDFLMAGLLYNQLISIFIFLTIPSRLPLC